MPPRTPFADVSNNDSTSDPTVTDDASAGWDVGSRWINTANGKVWYAVDVTAGAAVWKDVTGASSGSHPVHIDTVDPTVTDDSNSGFSVGDHWVNTANKTVWTAVDVSVGAAVWDRVDQIKHGISASAPTVSDDNTQGYEIGSWWVDTSTGRVYRAVDVSTGAAVWTRSTNLKSNIAASSPTSTDDSTQGYEIGSLWVNTTADQAFIAVDVTATAAVWVRASNRKNTIIASTNPTVNDDNTQGYEIGSWWINTTFPYLVWRAIDVSTGAAVWRRTNNLAINQTASVDPEVTDDGTLGYEVGSRWINITDDSEYVCVDASTGAAVWKETSNYPGAGKQTPKEHFLGGSTMFYGATGSMRAANEVQYSRVWLTAGLVLGTVRVFIDSGGSPSRTIRLGLYNQTTPDDPFGVPVTRLQQTAEVTTNTVGFYSVPLGGSVTITESGYYWIAMVASTTSVKFAITPIVYRADFVPTYREVTAAQVLPATVGTITNPEATITYASLVEV